MYPLVTPCCLLLAVLFLAEAAESAEYFVAPMGSDQNDGSESRPFGTLAHAAEKMSPGDVCWLRQGTYRDAHVLKGIRGKPGKPLVFRSFPGEQVVLDGTRALPPRWTAWKDGIYRMRIDGAIWQLFVDRRLVYVARWPNASFEDGSIWRMAECMRFTDRRFVKGKYTGRTQDGLIVDRNPYPQDDDPTYEGSAQRTPKNNANHTTLAETRVDFTGAVAVLNLHHWLTWARPITDHEAGRDWFRYDKRGTEMAKYVNYYILGLPALDRQNEWWYDASSGTVYFRPPGDVDPNQLAVSGKSQDYSLRLIDCSHLTFHGIDFFASTFSLTDCDHVTIEDSRLMYPSTHKFLLGDYSWFSASADPDRLSEPKATPTPRGNVMTRIVNRGSGPYRNVVRNCEIAFANSPALVVDSYGSVVENCYIHDIEWDVNSSGGSGTLPGGAGCVIRRNTIHSAGNSEGIRPGPESTVEYNHLWHMGNLQHDGAAINIGTGAQRGTVVRYNWVHDTNRQAIRFDSTVSRMGAGGCAHHNVAFNLRGRGSKFKGDYHLLFNNTIGDGYLAIPNQYGDTPEHNRHTLAQNNLVDGLVAWTPKRPHEPINARLQCNLAGPGVVAHNLRDPANLDFRPKPDSAIVDAGEPIAIEDRPLSDVRVVPPAFIGNAPDIGAYEFGDRTYWIPGRKLAKASSPVPPDGVKCVKSDGDLMFLEAIGARRHMVYLTDIEGDQHRVLVVDGTNIADPGGLLPGHSYSWRVDAVIPDGTIVKGDEWSFTVESD